MRYYEISLQEKTIIIPDQSGLNFVIMHNPSRSQFRKFLFNPDFHMKGWLSPKDIWCWPAWHAHHHQIANALGLDPVADGLVGIFLQPNGILVNDIETAKYHHFPSLIRLYGNTFTVEST